MYRCRMEIFTAVLEVLHTSSDARKILMSQFSKSHLSDIVRGERHTHLAHIDYFQHSHILHMLAHSTN